MPKAAVVLRALAVAGVATAASACDTQVAEVDRIPSPDGKVDLVISTADGGATTAVAYHLSLVPAQVAADLETSIFIADHVGGLTAYWRSPELLMIECGDARVFHFTNFWQSGEVDDFRHVVRIGLSGGCV